MLHFFRSPPPGGGERVCFCVVRPLKTQKSTRFFYDGGKPHGMDLSFHRGYPGGRMGHLPEIFPGIDPHGLVGGHHCGYDRKFRLSVPGHQDAALGHSLRNLDRDWRSGRSGGGRGSLQRTRQCGPALLCGPAFGGDRGSEIYILNRLR